MAILGDNPFAALTFIAAPAVLTNASSVLALGTSNRFARAVDRQRQLSAMLEGPMADAATGALRIRQLGYAGRRAQLLLRALTCFYLSLGAFASAALISILGATAVASVGNDYINFINRLIAVATGITGVGGLVFGCSLLVHETRITLRSLKEETAFVENRYRARQATRSAEPQQPAAAAGGLAPGAAGAIQG